MVPSGQQPISAVRWNPVLYEVVLKCFGEWFPLAHWEAAKAEAQAFAVAPQADVLVPSAEGCLLNPRPLKVAATPPATQAYPVVIQDDFLRNLVQNPDQKESAQCKERKGHEQ
jgi:hypothetical protein